MADTVVSGVTISDDIFSKCVPAASVDASLCDGFAFEDIKPTTQADLATIYTNAAGDGQFRLVGTLLEPDFIGVACQRRRNGFADLLRGTARVIDGKKLSVNALGPGQYEVMPFVKMGVVNPINNHTWIFASGQAAGTTETSPNTNATFTWKGTVTSTRGIPLNERWFNPGTTVHIHSNLAGVNQIPVYKVVDSELANDVLTIYLLNVSANAADPLYALDADARGNPTGGILTRGLPNVHPEESFCNDLPGLNTNQNKIFWVQGARRSFCVDDRVNDLLTLVEQNNAFYRRFGMVESVQRLRQQAEDYDNQIVHSFLFGSAISANQTLANYASLEKVQIYGGDANSPTFSHSGQYFAYRAQAIGLLPMLAECEDEDGTPAYVDMTGDKVDIESLKQWLWRLSQMRSSLGKSGDAKIIRAWVHSQYREVIVNGFIQYFKTKSVDTLRMNFDVNESAFGFTYRDIKLDHPNVTLRLMSEATFDDWLDDFKKAGNADNLNDPTFYKAGTMMLFLEWSTIYRLILEGGKVVLESGTPQDHAKVDSAFLCGPLRIPKKKVSHWWEIFTNVVECPLTQKAIVNFDDTELLQAPTA